MRQEAGLQYAMPLLGDGSQVSLAELVEGFPRHMRASVHPRTFVARETPTVARMAQQFSDTAAWESARASCNMPGYEDANTCRGYKEARAPIGRLSAFSWLFE